MAMKQRNKGFAFLFVCLGSSILFVTDACDDNAYPADSTKASKLTPNTFHKLCPSSSSLGKPICGDGTPFSFYYSSPIQRRSSNKILIEFLGGGACWDATTCEYQAKMLTFPYAFDDFLGMSCTEIQAGLDQNGGQYQGGDYPLNMLCAQTLTSGDNKAVDFRDYHTIIVPYCTQDTHMGSNIVTYDDGTTVHHTGAHNLASVLEWIYSNFPHPEHIVLTGCSAGGTVLPIAYDLLYHHYNNWRKGKQMALSTIMDSPVYLTPSYFLEYGYPNWNVQPIMKKLRFNFNKYSQSTEYSTAVMKHVLKRGSNENQWGLITHTQDPVSLAYYQAMSSGYDQANRRLDDNEQAVEEAWWNELSSSIENIASSHGNVHSYLIDGEGHCSFGLYYGIKEGGDDFTSWAANILSVRRVAAPSGRGWFCASILVGTGLVSVILLLQRRQHAGAGGSAKSDGVMLSSKSSGGTWWRRKDCSMVSTSAKAIAAYTKDAPATIAYGVTVTVYFIGMITWGGLEDIIYNPSIGPSATTLSAFGINNPTLVVYRHQYLRVLVTSTFLCSGIVTFLMLVVSLYRYIRQLEEVMRAMSIAPDETKGLFLASASFVQVAALISIASNIMYAFMGNGASCSSIALIMGLQAFSCIMHRYHQQPDFPAPYGVTLAMFLVTCLFLPFNSWIMMLSAMSVGAGLAFGVYFCTPAGSMTPASTDGSADDQYTSYSEQQQQHQTQTDKPCNKSVLLVSRTYPFRGLVAVLAILFVCLVVRIRRPDRKYEQPFLTGCELVYTSHVDAIVNSYAGGQVANYNNGDNNGNNRNLEEQENDGEGEEQDEQHMCAQFCVPHLVSRPLIWGANLYTGFDVRRGWCEDFGYSQHIADKTFSYKSYSVDVELYYDDNYSMNANDDRKD
jgi:Pectinacetylesterase